MIYIAKVLKHYERLTPINHSCIFYKLQQITKSIETKTTKTKQQKISAAPDEPLYRRGSHSVCVGGGVLANKKSLGTDTQGLTKVIAEREGFEPPVPLSTTVFKTVVIDHSTISPFTWKNKFRAQKRVQR